MIICFESLSLYRHRYPSSSSQHSDFPFSLDISTFVHVSCIDGQRWVGIDQTIQVLQIENSFSHMDRQIDRQVGRQLQITEISGISRDKKQEFWEMYDEKEEKGQKVQNEKDQEMQDEKENYQERCRMRRRKIKMQDEGRRIRMCWMRRKRKIRRCRIKRRRIRRRRMRKRRGIRRCRMRRRRRISCVL